jgi:hypothetical protein
MSLACLDLIAAEESTTETTTKETPPPQNVALAEGKLQLAVPGNWEKTPPRSNIIEHEFSIPPVDPDKDAGRMTIMRSGGGVEANIKRWQDQFSPPADADPEKASKIEKKQLAGLEVHLADLSGTFHDRPRPFGPVIDREGYRMLAAIIRAKDAGDYFIKFYGPQATVAEHAEAFRQMIDELKWTGN